MFNRLMETRGSESEPVSPRYEFQCQYGSIGWAVGATLGYAFGAGKKKRVISSIGDGSFQVTAQDMSTMIHTGQNPIIFLINNKVRLAFPQIKFQACLERCTSVYTRAEWQSGRHDVM